MLLLVKGGNLNTLNDEGYTPLAYGSERILSLLDLNAGVATFHKQGSTINELPAEYDNNYLMNRNNWNKPKEAIEAKIKYAPIRSPTDSVRNNDKSIQQYIEPGNLEESLQKP